MIWVVFFCSLPGEGTILFTKQINRTDQLYVLDLQGKEIAITHHPRKDSSPALSPDGTKIAFASEREGWWKIWLFDLQSQAFKQLTFHSSAEYGPTWSPDGKHIAFTSSRDGNTEIYAMTAEGKDLRNITQNQAPDTTPSWNQEGILFSRQIKGTYQILRIDPNTGKEEVLTNSDGNKMLPQTSPVNDSILYYGDKHGNWDIYIQSGNLESRLTRHPLGDIRPKWSPDGNWIVFERGNKKDNQHIYVMKNDGSEQKQLTFNNYNYAPFWVANPKSLQSFISKKD